MQGSPGLQARHCPAGAVLLHGHALTDAMPHGLFGSVMNSQGHDGDIVFTARVIGERDEVLCSLAHIVGPCEGVEDRSRIDSSCQAIGAEQQHVAGV